MFKCVFVTNYTNCPRKYVSLKMILHDSSHCTRRFYLLAPRCVTQYTCIFSYSFGHEMMLPSPQKCTDSVGKERHSCVLTDVRLWLPETLGRCSTSPLAEEKRLAELLVSTPPRRGRKWLTDTCSMKDVPYFLKYHHSKIWARGCRLMTRKKGVRGNGTKTDISHVIFYVFPLLVCRAVKSSLSPGFSGFLPKNKAVH